MRHRITRLSDFDSPGYVSTADTALFFQFVDFWRSCPERKDGQQSRAGPTSSSSRCIPSSRPVGRIWRTASSVSATSVSATAVSATVSATVSAPAGRIWGSCGVSATTNSSVWSGSCVSGRLSTRSTRVPTAGCATSQRRRREHHACRPRGLPYKRASALFAQRSWKPIPPRTLPLREAEGCGVGLPRRTTRGIGSSASARGSASAASATAHPEWSRLSSSHGAACPSASRRSSVRRP